MNNCGFAALDISLRWAGIDLNFVDAQKIKKLGKDTPNPFKFAAEVQRDIDSIVEFR